MEGIDELGHGVYTLASVSVVEELNDTADLLLENSMEVLSPVTKNRLPFTYQVASEKEYQDLVKNSAQHRIEVVDLYSTSKNAKFSFDLQTISCRPGFTFREQKCVCDEENVDVLR